MLFLILLTTDLTQLLVQLTNISIPTVALLLIILVINLFLVSFRHWRTLSHFHFELPYNVAFRANMAGYLGGLFVWSLLGQTMGRQTVLANSGVRPTVVAFLTAYERIILALISFVFALRSTY